MARDTMRTVHSEPGKFCPRRNILRRVAQICQEEAGLAVMAESKWGVPGRPAGGHFSKSARSGAPLSYFARCSTASLGYTPPRCGPAASAVLLLLT